MKARFLSALLFAVALVIFADVAGQESRAVHVGFLRGGAPDPYIDAFREAMRELGYVEGKNLSITERSAYGEYERLPGLAAELVRLKVDLVVTASTPATLAAKSASTSIPIVVAVSGDPVGSGLVSSLSHPGGNVTGLALMLDEIAVKRLELLREAAPGISRVAVLWNRANPAGFSDTLLRQMQDAATRLRLRLDIVEISNASELGQALRRIQQAHSDALFVFEDAVFRSKAPQIIEFTAKARLPAVYGRREYVSEGGLIYYGTSYPELYRRAAAYVDKILKGANPGDLPIEQPTKFELVVNLKTAKALGLTIPESILLRADEVIR